MAINTVSPIRFFITLVIGIALTIGIMMELEDIILDGIGFYNTRLTAGIVFGITVPIGLAFSFPRLQTLAFLFGSAIIYYLVVTTYTSQLYHGSILVILVGFILGAVAELLLFSGLFSFLKQVKWWHVLIVISIGFISPYLLDIVGIYVSIAIWQLGVGSAFYSIARQASKKD